MIRFNFEDQKRLILIAGPRLYRSSDIRWVCLDYSEFVKYHTASARHFRQTIPLNVFLDKRIPNFLENGLRLR